MAAIENQWVPAGALPSKRRRRLVDEASVLATLLVADCLHTERLRTMEPTPVLTNPVATASLRMRLTNGWASLATPGFLSDLRTLHDQLDEIYRRIVAACCEGATGSWRRPRLVHRSAGAVELPLSSPSRSVLDHYLSRLKPELIDDTTAVRANQEHATHIYPLAGLAYSVCISEAAGDVFLYLRANVFSDLGGAGVSVVNGRLVKVRKGAGILTSEQLRERGQFQRQYLTRLRRDHWADRALFPAIAGVA